MPAVKLSRRALLTTAVTTVAACATRRVAQAADHGLNLGIQLYSLRGYPVDDALRHAREIGFRNVEF